MKIGVILLAACAVVASAAPAAGPYDEAADARAAIAQAQAAATAGRVPVLVVFGANWCGDCKMLDAAMTQGPSAAVMQRDFRVVKVDVGRFDRNVDIATRYGVPLKQGIPSVAVLSPAGDVLYATQAGELANARKMGDVAIHDFFVRVAGSTRR